MYSSTELRVFLSSTFIDFQNERDYLAKKVFPALRRLCRERGIEFTEIDFRWGLTTEDSKKGRIIRSCLAEIDSCRPFFVGFLGDRYGWVPPIDELEKDPDLRKEEPWLEDAFKHGQSVTEMEFRHGFLNQSPGQTRPLIYFRKSTPGEEDPRIARLKRDTVGYVGKVPVFSSPEEFAQLLERDLTKLIEEHWPVSTKHAWLDEERIGHAAFAQSRRKAYVPDFDLLGHIDDHITAKDPVLIVTGESGGGKSSLLSYWAESYREKQPNAFVIEHYIGVTAASNDRDTIMRRIIEEIRERIHAEEPPPQSSEELERSFPSWLGRVSGEKLVIVIDAINQLSTDDIAGGHFLSWLPAHMPENIKWVVSAIPSEALDRLRQRTVETGTRWPELLVGPIQPNTRRKVLRAFLADYRKKLARPQENRIIEDEKSSSPLFLRTLLEELRLQGEHEKLDAQIEYYLASKDIADLFTRILGRIEVDYGATDVRALLRAIWAAPYGLSESELMEASGLERSTLSLLLHAFDFHFVRMKGRLSFFHDHLRQAIERRYMGSLQEKQQAWSELARYFESTEASPIKAHSLPWLLVRAEDWDSLKRSLLEVELLAYLTEGSRNYDLLTYWLALDKHFAANSEATSEKRNWSIDVVAEYEAALALQQASLERTKERSLRYALALFFHNAGWFGGAISSAQRALALYTAEETKQDTDAIIDIELELGVTYLDNGDIANAAKSLEEALKLVEVTAPEARAARLRAIQVRSQYALLLKQQGRYPESEKMARDAMKVSREWLGTEDYATIRAMRYTADALAFQGKYDEAEKFYQEVLRKVEGSLGPESLEMADSLNEYALFLSKLGKSEAETRQSYERARAILESRLGPTHPDVGSILANIASFLSEHSKFEEAEAVFQRSLRIGELAYGPEHPNVATRLNNYASLLYRQQKYDRAEPYYRQTLAIRRKTLGPKHPQTAVALNNLANALRRAGKKLDEAEACYKEALEIRVATIGANHLSTAFTLSAYGQLMRMKGDLRKSLELLEQAYAIYKEVRGVQHRDTAPIALEVAEVALELSEQERAQTVIDESLLTVDMKSLTSELLGRLERLLAAAMQPA